MNIRFLETLVWLTRLRSFNRTAEKLHATQPAVSNRICTLEELLGVELYDRNARPFQLTAAGRRILPFAEQIVSLAEELQAAASSDRQQTPVSIGVIELVTMSWLSDLITELVDSLPEARIYFGSGTSMQLIKQLRAREMDLTFVIGPVEEPDIKVRPICTIQQAWMASPRHFDCEAEIDIVELSRLPLILHQTGSSGYDLMTSYFRGHGLTNLTALERRLTIDCAYSPATSVNIVRSGLAIIPLPPLLFRSDVEAGRLAAMNVRQSLPDLTVCACWRASSVNSRIEELVMRSVLAAMAFAGRENPQDMKIIDPITTEDSARSELRIGLGPLTHGSLPG